MVIMGGQYEYNIDAAQPVKPQPQKTQNPNQANGTTILPKRTPNSELTSYQSEKRLKEYKQQQQLLANAQSQPAQQQAQTTQGSNALQQHINANSRQ